MRHASHGFSLQVMYGPCTEYMYYEEIFKMLVSDVFKKSAFRYVRYSSAVFFFPKGACKQVVDRKMFSLFPRRNIP